MSMTKKDYIMIAKAFFDVNLETWAHEKHGELTISFATANASRLALQLTARKIADYLAYDNQAFDRQKFLEACGIF